SIIVWNPLRIDKFKLLIGCLCCLFFILTGSLSSFFQFSINSTLYMPKTKLYGCLVIPCRLDCINFTNIFINQDKCWENIFPSQGQKKFSKNSLMVLNTIIVITIGNVLQQYKCDHI